MNPLRGRGELLIDPNKEIACLIVLLGCAVIAVGSLRAIVWMAARILEYRAMDREDERRAREAE